MQLYVGNLGLNSGAPQNVNQLNTAAMTPYFTNAQVIPIALGQTLQLPIAHQERQERRLLDLVPLGDAVFAVPGQR